MDAELTYAFGPPPVGGLLRYEPEDFQVVEDLGFAPDGAGEHVMLRVRKRDANTEWVARQIAGFAGVVQRQVSFAGLKDRRAVAEQWFSVHLPRGHEPDWLDCRGEGFEVLESARHSRKLRRGALRGNHFRLTIRQLTGDHGEVGARLRRVAVRGVPNYFGQQRFGHNGSNLVRAERLFAGTEKVRDRHKRGLYLSAARAFLFNEILSRRVADGSWDRALAGDVMMLAGSHSVFATEAWDEAIQQRVEEGDLHPTGPLWGAGELMSRLEVREREQALVLDHPLLCRGLEEEGLNQERRALRVPVQEVQLESPAPDTVVVAFWLPAGSYATMVVRELVRAEEV